MLNINTYTANSFYILNGPNWGFAPYYYLAFFICFLCQLTVDNIYGYKCFMVALKGSRTLFNFFLVATTAHRLFESYDKLPLERTDVLFVVCLGNTSSLVLKLLY